MNKEKLFPALMTEDQTRFLIRFVREDVKVFKEKKKKNEWPFLRN